MPLKDRTIGSQNEQGGPNMGNDYSRDITREKTSDDTLKNVIPHKDELKRKREVEEEEEQDMMDEEEDESF